MGITIVSRAGLVARRRRFRILEAETPFNSLADCRIPNVKLPFSHNFTSFLTCVVLQGPTHVFAGRIRAKTSGSFEQSCEPAFAAVSFQNA